MIPDCSFPTRLRYAVGVRRATLACGFLCFLVGLLALAYDLYGPTYSYSTCSSSSTGPSSCASGTSSLVQTGLTETAAIFIAFVALVFLAVFVASLLVYLHRPIAGLLALGVALFLLAVSTFISGFSIGYSFLPSDLFAILALIFALRHPKPTPCLTPADDQPGVAS